MPSTKPTSETPRGPLPKTSESKRAASSAGSASPSPMEKLLADLADGKYKKVIVMAGAGISTAAGIPDFRSPKTGLYANLQRFKLPYPEAVFDIDYLRDHPEPFFMLAGEMYPSRFEPTSFHRFIRWLSDLGVLKRVYTQNIDTLERRAGVHADKIVEAHGSFSANHCIDCGTEADAVEVERIVLEEHTVPKCEECGGIVKPDIVFFGEGLPERFFELLEVDFDDVDLAIVAGTSLQVGPFNQLPDMVPSTVPRYLLNYERAGSLGTRKNDVLVLGKLEELDPLFAKHISPGTRKRSAEATKGEFKEAAKAPAASSPVKPAKGSTDKAVEEQSSERADSTGSTEKEPDVNVASDRGDGGSNADSDKAESGSSESGKSDNDGRSDKGDTASPHGKRSEDGRGMLAAMDNLHI